VSPLHSALGFEIGPVRRQKARWPGLGGLLALAAGALCVILQPPLPAPVLAMVLLAAGVAAWAGWRSGRSSASGRLLVDPAGNAGWVAESASDRAAAVPIVPRRWQLGSDEIWLLAEDGRGARLHLRLSRPACDECQWRALRRWLVWSARGNPAVVST
jgi:hypothetical protein